MSIQEIRYALANNLAMGTGWCEAKLRELLDELDDRQRVVDDLSDANEALRKRGTAGDQLEAVLIKAHKTAERERDELRERERRILAILDGASEPTLHGLVEDVRAVLTEAK